METVINRLSQNINNLMIKVKTLQARHAQLVEQHATEVSLLSKQLEESNLLAQAKIYELEQTNAQLLVTLTQLHGRLSHVMAHLPSAEPVALATKETSNV